MTPRCMSSGMWPGLFSGLIVAACMTGIAGCNRSNPATSAIPSQAHSRQLLETYLPELAKAHADKQLLAFFVAFKQLDPPVRRFTQTMQKSQEPLAQQLKAWAKAQQISLDFRYDSTPWGQARQAQENAQSRLLRADKAADFQRDMIVLMWIDYDWQIHLIDALLPAAPDTELRDYLLASRKVHEAGLKEARELLEHYRWKE